MPPGPIVLYDGECGLCHRSVQFLIARDGGKLHYAPLQGETTESLRAQYPAIPTALDTVVLVDNNRLYLRSKAFLYVTKYLRGPVRWLYHLRWLPAPLLDLGYRLIAKLRYRIWGKYDSCQRPSTTQQQQLLP